MANRRGTFVVGSGVECDVDRLINTRLLVQAMSGAGKSWTLRRILEQSHGLVQQLVIDPEGEFSSLRQKFDYVLAARQGGDTLADTRTAKLLAERLLELGVSAILDISELQPHERIRFVRTFFETLVDAPKTLWHPMLVVLDEANQFAPEKGDAESADAVKSLAARGRKRGFCLVAATQRLSKLHKDVAAECGNKLIGRTTLDVDMARAGDELGFGKAERLALRDLDDGEFFAFGPALTKVVTKVRVGTVQTTHPKAGSTLAAIVPPPTDRVKAVLSKLADLPAEAEQRAKSEKELRDEIRTLKHRLTEAEKAQPEAVETVREVEVLKDSQIARVEKMYDRFEKALGALGDLKTTLHEILSVMHATQQKSWPPTRKMPPAKVLGDRVAPRAATTRPVAEDVDDPPARAALTGPERRILDAISWLNGVGVEEPENTAVAFMARYSPGGGAYNNPKGSLRSKGLIDYRGDKLALTDAGRALAEIPPQDITHEELQARVLERLPGPERKLMAALIEAWPNALSDEILAEKTNYAVGGGAFNNPKGRLRTLGLIEYPHRGHARARDILWLQEA